MAEMAVRNGADLRVRQFRVVQDRHGCRHGLQPERLEMLLPSMSTAPTLGGDPPLPSRSGQIEIVLLVTTIRPADASGGVRPRPGGRFRDAA
jgi:hypothetical protein